MSGIFLTTPRRRGFRPRPGKPGGRGAMGRHWGLGPVFASEWLTTSRRRQFYAGRALFVGVMLVGLSCVWGSRVACRTFATISDLARVGQSFFSAIAFTQLITVM